jgi:hypothetical protein
MLRLHIDQISQADGSKIPSGFFAGSFGAIHNQHWNAIDDGVGTPARSANQP